MVSLRFADFPDVPVVIYWLSLSLDQILLWHGIHYNETQGDWNFRLWEKAHEKNDSHSPVNHRLPGIFLFAFAGFATPSYSSYPGPFIRSLHGLLNCWKAADKAPPSLENASGCRGFKRMRLLQPLPFVLSSFLLLGDNCNGWSSSQHLGPWGLGLQSRGNNLERTWVPEDFLAWNHLTSRGLAASGLSPESENLSIF